VGVDNDIRAMVRRHGCHTPTTRALSAGEQQDVPAIGRSGNASARHTANVEVRRVLIHELIELVKMFPNHAEVKVVGAPQLNVRLREVRLKVPEIVGVGEPSTIPDWRLASWRSWEETKLR
jgi:hypothetical protein